MAALDDVVVTSSVTIPAGFLQERFSRSSGPGGQGVNTADSRVELVFDVTAFPGFSQAQRRRVLDRLAAKLVSGCVVVVASEYRQQLANRKVARERLAQILREALAPPGPVRRRTKPTRGSKERRLQAKQRRSDLKRNRQTPKE